MVKRFLLIPLMIVLVSGLILGGCAAPAPAPAPAAPGPGPTPSPAPGPVAPAPPTPEKYTINFAGWGPLSHGVYQGGFLCWEQDVEELSGGRIEVNTYTDAVLCPPDEVPRALKEGLIDASFYMPVELPGVYPVTAVYQLPFLGPTNNASGASIHYDIMDEFPEVASEHTGLKVLGLWATAGGYGLHMDTKPIRTSEDLKGQVIGSLEGTAKVLETMGASVAIMPWSDFYTSVDKGVIDGIMFTFETLVTLNFGEVTQYHTDLPSTTDVSYLAMSQQKWDSFPPDLQEVLLQASSKELFGLRMAEIGYQLGQIGGYKLAESPGHETYYLDPEELNKIVALCQPMYQEWIDMVVGKGLMTTARAQELIDRIQTLAEKYNPMYDDWTTRDMEGQYNMDHYDHWVPGWGR